MRTTLDGIRGGFRAPCLRAWREGGIYEPLMHPILFEIRGLSVHTYGVVYLLAFLAAIAVAATLARRDGVPFWKTVDVAFMIAIAGEVGARLTFAVVEWERILGGSIGFRQFLTGGRVVLGGVVAGVLFAAWILRRQRLPAAGLLDSILTGAALGMAIGRLACLGAGCCYGGPTDWWWGITFQDPLAARLEGTPLGVALHPTQIVQSLAALAVFAFLLGLHARRRFPGQVAASFLALTGMTRFVTEFLRGDARGTVGGVSTSQWIGLAMVACGATWLWLGRRRAADGGPRGKTRELSGTPA